ncbi:MAG: DUF2961 domain-containing protein [Planctomycetes bacterium]|nr:DUF2961 domain-containing protein [Planctomycetota bacterium]
MPTIRSRRILKLVLLVCILSLFNCGKNRSSQASSQSYGSEDASPDFAAEIDYSLVSYPAVNLSGSNNGAGSAAFLPVNGNTEGIAKLPAPHDNKVRSYMRSSNDVSNVYNCDGFVGCSPVMKLYMETDEDGKSVYVIFNEEVNSSNEFVVITRMNFCATEPNSLPPSLPVGYSISDLTTYNFNQTLSIYLDGSQIPTYKGPVVDLFSNPPFSQFASYQSGGLTSYAQIAAKHIKITSPIEPLYYEIEYKFTNSVTDISSWSGVFDSAGSWPHSLQQNWSQLGEITLPTTSDGVTIMNIGDPGVFLGWRFEVNSVKHWKDLWIDFFWNGSQTSQVSVPIGMLCGASGYTYAIDSVFFQLRDNIGLTYFPMPFRSAVVRMRNLSPSQTVVRLSCAYLQGLYPEPYGLFHAVYSDSNPVVPDIYHPIANFNNCQGIYVGLVMETELTNCTPNGSSNYLEGDIAIYKDGKGSADYLGTGTEVYFNMGWYGMFIFEQKNSLPLNGYSGVNEIGAGTPCVGEARSFYRLMPTCPVYFSNSIRVSLEHGPANDVAARYTTAGFFYVKDSPGLILSDELDVGNPASESAHQYTAIGETILTTLSSRYQGDESLRQFEDTGRISGGTIRFNANISSNNSGVRLRCRIDQINGFEADVYVDNVYVGRWLEAFGIPTGIPFTIQPPFPLQFPFRWYESEFSIPVEFTRGKSMIQITVLPVEGSAQRREFQYWIYSCR